MRHSRLHLLIVASIVVLSLPSLVSSQAAELRLTLANDPISGNNRKDDLYTSETALELRLPERHITFSERMFTNRDENIRFDETRVAVTFGPRDFQGWSATTELGVLHVGKGLLGESVQNRVHRAVGSREVYLPYIEDDSFHPTAVVSLRRQLAVVGGTPVHANIRMETAPAFRSSLDARVGLVRDLGRTMTIEIGAGLRGDYVENRWLDDVVSEVGPAASLAFAWRGIALSFTHNHYGTRSNHITLGWRASLTE